TRPTEAVSIASASWPVAVSQTRIVRSSAEINVLPTVDGCRGSREPALLLAGGHVPEVDGLIFPPEGRRSAVRRNGDRQNSLRRDPAELLPVGHVPDGDAGGPGGR